jgi:hypothetical protein
MKREFEEYFAERFRYLRRGRGPARRIYPPFLTEELLSRIPKQWRSDARYFLASNMLNMVVFPYDEVEGPDVDLLPGGKAWELIFNDLLELIQKSESTARERDRSYVSATSVAIALGEMSENLRTTSLRIWGSED